MNRRSFLAGAAAPLFAEPQAEGARAQLTAYLAGQVDQLALDWDARRARIKTKAQMQARNAEVRRLTAAMLGPAAPPCPLNARITGSTERQGYRVDNLIYDAQPGLPVAANLYVPAGAGPFAAVISPCGHYELARMHPDYQLAYIGLALAGFIVLAYDPPGQGERRHYWNRATNQNDDGLRSVDEHSMSGHLLLLLGDSLTNLMVHDGRRAIDYLLTRADVDKSKIACAGHSGGGTLTMFLAAVEPRIACAVINEGGTAHRWPVVLRKDGTPPVADAEQNLFPAARHGIDTCDLHAAVAPRPLLALIENYAEPFNRSAAHIGARFELLGVKERFETAEAQARHAWTAKLRLATTDFCSRHLLAKPGPATEAGRAPEPNQTLLATPQGRLDETIFPSIAKRAATIDAARNPNAAALGRLLPRLLRIAPPQQPPPFTASPDGASYTITPEPGITLHATAYRPAAATRRPILLVSAQGRASLAASAQALAAQGAPVLAFDPRGVEPAAPAKPYAHLFDAETGLAYLAWSCDKDLFGMRAGDILAAAHLARALFKTPSIAAAGFGAAANWLLCAAALDPHIISTVCHNGLLSWRTLLDSDRYSLGAQYLVRGIFPHCDLPHIAATLAPRRLTLSAPLDAAGQPAAATHIEQAYSFTRSAYNTRSASAHFSISTREPDPAQLLHWLG